MEQRRRGIGARWPAAAGTGRIGAGVRIDLTAMVGRQRAVWESGVRATPMGVSWTDVAAWQLGQPLPSLSTGWHSMSGDSIHGTQPMVSRAWRRAHAGAAARIDRMSVPFVHLRLHSEFSVVDGLVQLDKAAKAAAADGQGALALTDSANMFGAIRFYKAARARGVKPIVGVDAWLSNDADRESPYRLLLLAMDHGGYLRLCDLVSRSWIENQHRGRAEMRLAWFEQSGGAGLIALSGAAQGEIGAQLALGNVPAASAAAERLAALFPDRFYIELQRAGRAGDEALLRASARLAIELDLPVVATHPVQFIARDDFRAHEARVCIAEGYTLADPRRPRHYTEEQYFKSGAEMALLFADMPAALANTGEIARRCNLELTLGKSRLPEFPTPAGVSIEQHCRELSQQGLLARLHSLYPDQAARAAQQPRYQARLDLELATIAEMGFAGYFLIVADFINWAKRNGIPVGPGRGSGAGSLVAYALGITDLDPLRYDLLFERFLNPERVSMPDFDIDFCQDNRDRVIDYVKRKYGPEAVSQIATFGTLGAKAVVRDVGRVLDLPYTKCDTLSKLIPHNPADPWTLERALKEEPAFAEAVANDEEYAELVELSRPLRHARRRRADRARPAHRLLPALLRRRRRDGGGQPVRQGRRRGDRAGQVRFPRADHAHDPRPDAALREAARSVVLADAGDAAAGRRRHLRDLQAGRHGGDLPV